MEMFKARGSWRLDVVGKDYVGEIKEEGFSAIENCHSSQTKTSFPNYISVGNKQLWDCAGSMDDTIGLAVRLSKIYCINHLMSRLTASEMNGVHIFCC